MPVGVFRAHVCHIIMVRVWLYIRSVGFCIAYSVTWFSQDLNSG